MFQDFALFPHMDVFENIAFGLRMARLPEDEAGQRVQEVLELVGLIGFERRDINTLSGGEQQRVALARSLAPWPRLLMLDEPLGSLDRNLRERLVSDIGKILRETRQTAIYVTHDQEEAFAIADQVVILNAGRVEQTGTPQQIYQLPASTFVARFLGLTNLMEGETRNLDGRKYVDLPIGQVPLPQAAEGPVTVLLRPERVALDGSGAYQIEGRIIQKSFRGNLCRLTVEVNGLQLAFDFLSFATPPIERQTVRIGFDPSEALQIFPR
jgi:ABC-type Fe3+/spermidine/putrescine transport system ATPase subunit